MSHFKLLKRLGFTEYEARAYLSLAKLGPSTVREIVLDSALPRNKTYEALQRLEQKNHISLLPMSPRRYRISNPETFKEEIKELDSSVDSLIKLVDLPKSKEFKDMFWVTQGKKALIEKFNIENRKIVKEMFGSSNLNQMLPKNMEGARLAVKKGADFRFITPFDKKYISVYKAWVAAGAKVRVYNKKKFGPFHPRFAIFDMKKARLTIGVPDVKTDDNEITFWTESKAFCAMLRYQYLSMWKHCEPIEKYLKK